jgi:hypothetical protein
MAVLRAGKRAGVMASEESIPVTGHEVVAEVADEPGHKPYKTPNGTPHASEFVQDKNYGFRAGKQKFRVAIAKIGRR